MAYEKAPVNPHGLFKIEGDVLRPTTFSRLDLREIHRYYQIEDLAKVDERLAGRGVRLRKLVDIAGPSYGTRFITVESLDGAFSASFPIDEISKTGVIVYETKGGEPLSPQDGGPARLIVPFHPDKCANVKSVGRMVVSREPGRDTRPSNATEHARIHASD